MSATMPPSRPQMTREQVEKILRARGIDPSKKVAVLAVRGYYDSVAGPGNQRGIWDDALFIVSPARSSGKRYFGAFNGNTDPSVARKGIAVLKPGIWHYKPGKHKILSPEGYKAFVQARMVTVIRDGTGPHTGYFGINIHRGGNGTSSLGCQTIPPVQWEEFRSALYTLLAEFKQSEFPYLLITEAERRTALGLQ